MKKIEIIKKQPCQQDRRDLTNVHPTQYTDDCHRRRDSTTLEQ